MKKILAITLAVALAFIVGFKDEISNSNWFNQAYTQISSVFGAGSKKPNIPKMLPVDQPIEENLSYEERLKKSDYYYDRGFLSFAINELVKASQLEPDRLPPYQRLMQIHFELLNYDKSISNANQILLLSPNDFEAQYYLVLTAVKQSRFEEAKNLMADLNKKGFSDIRFSYLNALLTMAEKNHEEAKVILKEIIKEGSGASADLVQKVNIILSSYEEFEFAQSAEELYLSELLAKAFNEVGEYELAIYKLKEILKDRADLRDSWVLLGFAYLNLEQYTFASTAFERAYDLDPQWPATQYFLGITYAELEDKKEAIVYLNYALTNGFEPTIVIQQKLADLYLDTQNYQKSVNAYEQVLKVNNQDINAYVKPIWIYLDFLKQPQKALSLAEQAVVYFPENPMTYNLLGWAQMGLENYVESELNLKKAIELNSDLAAAYYNLGQLYEKTNQEDKALSQYEKAYQLDQNGSIGNNSAKRYNAILTQQVDQ